MKKYFSLLMTATMAVSTLAFLASCGGDDPVEGDDTIVSGVHVTENISSNTTWETGKIYVLGGRITVLPGATLTIQPGVIVKGEAGTGSNATALLVARGAKLMAEGTAAEPIIFTSIADEIQPGDISSPNLDPDLNGLWGGVIILGSAHISGDADALQIEGIPPSDLNGLYGGSDDTDNSGTIRYISIRHGGANIGEGNEINGLTLGGVGSGTTIEFVEIVSNQDDGIEWFGGTVNVSNVVVWNTGDDGIDTDQGWNGTLNNVVVINPGDECFELDGPEGSYINGNFNISNATAYVQNADGLVDNDDNTNVNMSNIYFTDITITEDEYADGSYPDFDKVPSDYTCTFSGIEITLPASYKDADDNVIAIAPELTEFFTDGSDAFTSVVSSPTVGATLSAFDNWTWARVSGTF